MTDLTHKRPTLLASAGVCALVFAVLAVLVRTHVGWLAQLDHRSGVWPEHFTLTHAWVRHGFDIVSWVFSAYVLTPALLVFGALTWWRGQRRAGVWLLGVMVANEALTLLLKLAIGRDRPVWVDPVMRLGGYAFPSGHASRVAALAGIAIVFVQLTVRQRVWHRLTIIVTVLVALLVGADRIFLGVHTLSDVLAGYLVGATVVLVSLAWFDPAPTAGRGAAGADSAWALGSADRRLGVILNPAKVPETAAFRDSVEDAALAAGWAGVEWWETSVADTGYAMAHEAAVSGVAMVMAVGGDGTIRAVCEELAGTGIAVGIIPAGTGNLLARNLGIPLFLRSAVDVALNGQDRAIDLVEVSGDEMADAVFLVMAGMGFDAAIMEGVNEGFKAKVGWLAYVWSALKSLMFPAIRVEISVDGGPFTRHRARTIVIGNVGTLQAGMPLIPDAVIDDGLVDVVLLYPRRFLSWVPLAVRVLSKNKRTDETITRMKGASVVVRTTADTPRQLDGDPIAPGRELRATTKPGRLLVRVPR